MVGSLLLLSSILLNGLLLWILALSLHLSCLSIFIMAFARRRYAESLTASCAAILDNFTACSR